MDNVINTSVVAGLVLSGAALIMVLLWSVGTRVFRAPSRRRELRRQMGDVPMGTLLSRLGGDPGYYLRHTPPDEVAKRLRTCAACPDVAHCKRLLASRCGKSAFAFCPNIVALRGAAAEYEGGWNPYRSAGSALPPAA